MSVQTVVLNNGQQAIINTDLTKVFLFNRQSQEGTLLNATGAPVTYLEGQLLGRIGASNRLVPFAKAASDGSQFPVGVLIGQVTVAAGGTAKVFMCVAGDIAEEKLILGGADTPDTNVGGRTIRDLIQAETVGLKLVPSTDMSGGYDNQ